MYLNMPNLHFLPCNPGTSKARLTFCTQISLFSDQIKLYGLNHWEPIWSSVH